MPRFVIVVTMFLLVVPQVARAGDPEIPAEEEALYHCKNKTGQVAVTFKPETELKDLVTWAMGFTCKNFMFDPSYVQRGKKVTVIAPNTMSAAEAYRVFLAALSTIGLTIVPKGNILRIVESATARADTVPIYQHGMPADQEQVVRYVLRPTYAQPQTLQERERHQCQHRVVVQPAPGSPLEVIQPQLLLELLVRLLTRPPRLDRRNQRQQRRV